MPTGAPRCRGPQRCAGGPWGPLRIPRASSTKRTILLLLLLLLLPLLLLLLLLLCQGLNYLGESKETAVYAAALSLSYGAPLRPLGAPCTL